VPVFLLTSFHCAIITDHKKWSVVSNSGIAHGLNQHTNCTSLKLDFSAPGAMYVGCLYD